MIPLREYFRSVESIWLLWLVALLLLALLAQKTLRGWRWSDCRALLEGEEGAAYSISYVLAFPVYLLLLCLIIESTLLLLAKIGTVYAAYAGARSAIVWLSVEPERAQEKSELAVVQALAPFASSSDLHLQGAGVSSSSSTQARQFAEAYRNYAGGQTPVSYLTAKYGYAKKATQVDVPKQSPSWDQDVTVTVTYQAPFTVGAIGRILGKRAPWSGARFYTYTIISKVALQSEAAKNPSQQIGIDYHVPN